MNKLGVCYQRDTEDLMLSRNSLLEEKACNSVVNIVLEIVSTGGIRKNIFHCAQLEEKEEAW